MRIRFTLVSSRNDQDRHVVIGESHDHFDALTEAFADGPPSDGRPLVFLEDADGWFVQSVQDISDDGGAEAREAKAEAVRMWQMMGLRLNDSLN